VAERAEGRRLAAPISLAPAWRRRKLRSSWPTDCVSPNEGAPADFLFFSFPGRPGRIQIIERAQFMNIGRHPEVVIAPDWPLALRPGEGNGPLRKTDGARDMAMYGENSDGRWRSTGSSNGRWTGWRKKRPRMETGPLPPRFRQSGECELHIQARVGISPQTGSRRALIPLAGGWHIPEKGHDLRPAISFRSLRISGLNRSLGDG